PLGRAEVSLTIDNTDGALPIEYTEVSITRRMFRDGASEYEINGNTCRLMDIQELLSDSGIGREMHVIVGQGQLAQILESKPEERRAFIEEAAGVLKHRKRKEKALRKLDAMQANLTRLTDLTSELRRQLKPLGKQAEIARKAQAVQADLRDARLRLHADDLVTQRTEIARDQADEAAARARRHEVEQALEVVDAKQTALEDALAADAPRLAAAQDTWYRLSALEERLRGTVRLAVERERHLSASSEATESAGRDPDELEEEATEIAIREAELAEHVEVARSMLGETAERRAELEQVVQAAEKAHLAAVRAVADRREGLARLSGQVEALRSKTGATAEEIERLSTNLVEATERAEDAAVELAESEAGTGVEDADDAGLADRFEQAKEAQRAAQARVEELVTAERTAEKDIASWKARVDALAMGLSRKDGAGALLAAADRLPGLLGSVAALLTVEPGHEAALAAALGPVADAVAVSSGDDAVAALRLLRADDAGRAGVLVGGRGDAERTGWPQLPPGAHWAVDLVRAPESLRGAVLRALDRVAVVDSLTAASDLVKRFPQVRAVTADGDVFGEHWVVGGADRGQSVIEVQAAVDEANEKLAASESAAERAAAALAGAKAEQQARAADASAAAEARNEAKVRAARSSERLNRLRQAVRSAQAEAERVQTQRAKVEQAREEALAKLAELEERLVTAEEHEPLDAEPDTAERDEASASLASARQQEMDARLTLRTAEERHRALYGKAEELRRAARAEREARERAARARAARARGAAIAQAVVAGGELALERIERSLAAAAAERDTVQAERHDRERVLIEVRNRVRELSTELEKLTDAVHRDEVLRAEQRLRLEQLETRIAETFGIGLDDLVAEYGPTVPVPPSPVEVAEYEAAKERGETVSAPQPIPYDRQTQERRAKRAERDLTLLGKVNPLALEEFAALEERYKFLSTQLEDLKATRRDLLTVVKEVDDKILEVFTSAYEDVAREFETVFATLFPGGEGRMVLTEPEDMLTTGVDVEARPPGKKIKRLSLLSGGEKSLVAVGMLVAIFRARPSPFYVLDEVEAALDDVNMRRLIGLLQELRHNSQLIVITHQKPTMDIADALYGVSMRGDGITQVISQRLHGKQEQEPAPA
ncbi:MAG TPA: chromosome segregation protein SMC, partial [Actinophytocola sp.]|nr:chromosome segregation protein SMC [Actinophytocola sp.]